MDIKDILNKVSGAYITTYQEQSKNQNVLRDNVREKAE